MDPLETELLEAAERCFARNGVAKTSMSHVAAEAGVSRTTLYRRFSRIEELLQAVFVREFDRFESRLRRRLRKVADPAERLVEIVVGTAENVPQSATIAKLIEWPRTRAEARALAVGRKALHERVEAMIDGPLDALASENLLREDLERTSIIEWIRRIVLSLAVQPQTRGRSTKARREWVAAFLLPSLCVPAPAESRPSKRKRV